MAIAFTQAELDALQSDVQRLGIFFRLDTSPPVRVWAGVGDCEVGADAFDASGASYSGLGQIVNVPAVEQLINGVAGRVELAMSGVSSEVVAPAAGEADVVDGKLAALGISLFGSDWQQLSPAVYWLWRGFADYVTVAQQSQGGQGIPQQIRTISLSIGTLFTGRRRRGLSYLTDRDQQERSPGDKFCERTVLYSMQYSKVWPRLLLS
jgi:hypothetical protein